MNIFCWLNLHLAPVWDLRVSATDCKYRILPSLLQPKWNIYKVNANSLIFRYNTLNIPLSIGRTYGIYMPSPGIEKGYILFPQSVVSGSVVVPKQNQFHSFQFSLAATAGMSRCPDLSPLKTVITNNNAIDLSLLFMRRQLIQN